MLSAVHLGIWGVVTLFVLGLTGWGAETEPADQLRRDGPLIVIAAITGAAAGAFASFALLGRASWRLLGAGMVTGCLPAGVRTVAYFTDAF